MKVLIVDDDFVSRRLIQTVLDHNSITDIHMVVSASEAVRSVELGHKWGAPYDLIFLDRIMPGEDGLSALRAIRDIELDLGLDNAHSAKIIMVTSVDNYEKVLDAFKDQCDEYVVKPINNEKIIEAIERTGLVLK